MVMPFNIWSSRISRALSLFAPILTHRHSKIWEPERFFNWDLELLEDLVRVRTRQWVGIQHLKIEIVLRKA